MGRFEQAVILAAGEGQRLRPFTAFKPKVMITIAGKPMVQYVIEALAANGVRRIAMVVGYRKEQVLDFLGAGEMFGVEIGYVTQPHQLGTAHALKQARDMVGDEFLVLSGDNIIEPDTIARFVESKPDSILIKRQEDVSKYGVVTVREGLVTDIVEKPKGAEDNLVNTGIYAFNQEIFDFIGEEVDLTAVLKNMTLRGRPLAAEETSSTWLDVVYPWDILKLNGWALGKISSSSGGIVERGVTTKGPVRVGKSTVIRSGSYIVGPAVIGESCEIGPSVFIAPSTTIGDNVIVFPFTEIRNSVIGNSVEIGSGSSVTDSIIDHGCVIKGRFVARSGEAEVRIDGEHHSLQMGAMLGEGCNIDEGVIVKPGVIIGNHCHIAAMRVVREKPPDGSLVV